MPRVLPWGSHYVPGRLFNTDVKRRVTGQKHVLFRLVEPLSIFRQDSNEELLLFAGILSEGSSVPGALWGALEAEPAGFTA